MEESRYNSPAPCSRFDDELEAFLEGEPRPFIASHARDCAACNGLLADLQAIRQTARDLPLEEPSRVVWANIRASLAEVGAFPAPPCSEFSAALEAYMEGEANPFIASHARDCASCGAVLADLQAIQQAARDLPQLEPSRAAWANLRATLAAEGAFARSDCAQFEAGLQAYLEGGVNPFMVSHARECAPCGILLADLQAIQQAAQDLPQEEPSRAVWANVRARLEAEGAFDRPVSGWRQLLAWRFSPHTVPLGVLASLVILGSALTLPSGNVQRWGFPEGVAGSSAAASLAPALSREDSALAQVVSDLESNFRANEASMTPDLKATYEKSLVSLDGSIRECLDSLQHEPRNTLAHDYLLTAYTRKAEVLSSALEFEGR
jgi:hypothetical protein